MRRTVFLLILFGLALGATSRPVNAGAAAAPCQSGFADGFPCENVDLIAHLTLAELGATDEADTGNDHWGWTDPATGRQYVLFGLTSGTTFVDITVPEAPVVLGYLPGHGASSVWRDVKVYENYAYVVADVPSNDHGLQVFDLTQLRHVVAPTESFVETAHYDGFGPGHNIWINEASGYLYAFRTDTCGTATHVVDLAVPAAPAFAGCVGLDDAPLSDGECIIYAGPDARFHGREICFTGSDDNVSIDDATDKAQVVALARAAYPGIARAHQGALTPDQRYWLLSDTMDEFTFGHNTRTHVYDVSDLAAPAYLGFYEHANTARDHNLYVAGQRMFQTNWKSGLRVLDISGLPDLDFDLLGAFDTAPDSDSVASAGSWSNYPWWPDALVTVSDTANGLFLLRLRPDEPTGVGLTNLGQGHTALWPGLIAALLFLVLATERLARRS